MAVMAQNGRRPDFGRSRSANDISGMGEGRVVAMTSKRINPNFRVFGCVAPYFSGKSYPSPARTAVRTVVSQVLNTRWSSSSDVFPSETSRRPSLWKVRQPSARAKALI